MLSGVERVLSIECVFKKFECELRVDKPRPYIYMYRFRFAGCCAFRLLGCTDFERSAAGGPFVLFSYTKRHRISPYVTPRANASTGVPVAFTTWPHCTTVVLLLLGKKPNIGIPKHFESFMGTLNIALGKKGLQAPPSDWPAPDRFYCWQNGFRNTSVWLLKLGFAYFWLQLYL